MARIPWYINSRPYSFEGGGDIFVGTQNEADKYAQSMGQHRGNQVSGVQNGLVRRAVDDKGNPVTMDGEQVYENPYMLDDVVVKAPDMRVAKAVRGYSMAQKPSKPSEPSEPSWLSRLAENQKDMGSLNIASPYLSVGSALVRTAAQDAWRRAHDNMFIFDYNFDGEGNSMPMPMKFLKGLWRKDKGREFYDKLAAADLLDEETANKYLDEYTALGKKGFLMGSTNIPVNTDALRIAQSGIRSRLDLMRLFDGRPQLYNTFKINPDYTAPDGTPRYTFANDFDRRQFNEDAANYIRWRDGNKEMTFSSPEDAKANAVKRYRNRDTKWADVTPTSNGKSLIYSVSGGAGSPFGDFSLVKDYNGQNKRWVDKWDYSMPDWFNKFLRVKPVATGDRIPEPYNLYSYIFPGTDELSPTFIQHRGAHDNDDHRWLNVSDRYE